ncbi:cytochrome d ubiquinol oxidase subunit II [Streptomyces alkaliterrae]|uniref:Cytochrome d ubiquinol oxidase subunit II n=1 Tax=Streptomyces alkaliterrae TaxID=2213162 RepID=A0A7W3WTQ4_9ACTN|nr:cytochrome d ubiquinol oxidase subunit II [Streptomyces alkaliterrae]MBB1258095.1 cytochrome d ubiquinol oxidase subunit II [Streptomyces alkaliterrae]
MDVFWYALVGLLLAGYLALESIDFGVGMLLPLAPSEAGRARVRRTIVPLFLANEVWLVAFVGLLFGALPLLEGKLLYALRLPLLALLTAWFLRDAALWFRGAHPGAAWRRTWDVVLPVSSLVLAAGWGAVLAALVRGLSTNGGGHAVLTATDLLHPFALLGGCVTVAGSLRQGALFTGRAVPGDSVHAVRLGRVRRAATPALLVLLLLTAVVGALTTGAPPAVAGVGALAAVCVLASEASLRSGRTFSALLFGAVPFLTAPLAVGAAHGTTVLATRSGAGELDLPEAIADAASLQLLAVTVLPVFLVVIPAQVWIWRVFAPTDRA